MQPYYARLAASCIHHKPQLFCLGSQPEQNQFIQSASQKVTQSLSTSSGNEIRILQVLYWFSVDSNPMNYCLRPLIWFVLLCRSIASRDLNTEDAQYNKQREREQKNKIKSKTKKDAQIIYKQENHLTCIETQSRAITTSAIMNWKRGKWRWKRRRRRRRGDKAKQLSMFISIIRRGEDGTKTMM